MSLEKVIEENTAAVKELTVALQQFAAGGTGAAAPTAKAEAPAKAATKKAESKPTEKTEEKADEPTGIPYDDVKAKTLELVKAKGRDTVVETLAKFGKGVKSAQDLKPEQYAEYIAAVDAILNDESLA